MQILNKLMSNITLKQSILTKFLFPPEITPFICNFSTLVTSNIPVKPKRPPSAFFRFVMDVRPKLVQEHPQAKLSDIIKVAATLWKSADNNIKESFENNYRNDLKSYKEAVEKYKSSLSDEQKKAITLNAIKKKRRKKLKILRHEMIRLGLPKRPASNFGLYVKDRMSERNNVAVKDWIKIVSNDWKNIPLNKKTEYNNKAELLRVDYELKMSEWKSDLKNSDIIRKLELMRLKKKTKRKGKLIKMKE